jgi:hypothetical protein
MSEYLEKMDILKKAVIGVSHGTGINSIMRKDSNLNSMDNGRLAEWFKALVLKTRLSKGNESSNLSSSVVHVPE